MKVWKWIAIPLSLICIVFFLQGNSDNKRNTTSPTGSLEKVKTNSKPNSHTGSNESIFTTKKQDNTGLSAARLSKLSEQFIVQCKNPYLVIEQIYAEKDFPKTDEIYQKWLKSDVFEHQFALALVHSNTVLDKTAVLKKEYLNNKKSLRELVNLHPESGLANYFLVSQCISSKDCESSIFEKAVEREPYNGALWKLIAITHAQMGNTELTLQALSKQATSPNYKTYWAEATHLYERVLLETGVNEPLQRQALAIGFTAALALPPSGKILEFCEEHSSTRADIAETCIQSGEVSFRLGDNMLEQALGLAQQRIAHEQLGNLARVRQLEALKRTFNDSLAQLTKANSLALVDSNLNKYWWESMLLYGETKALELTYAEAVRLSSDPDYNPCPNGKKAPNTDS